MKQKQLTFADVSAIMDKIPAAPAGVVPVVPGAGQWIAGVPPLRYTEADSARANKEWKATCGPHAIAAACGESLATVRTSLTGYRGWMSPTMMGEALHEMEVGYVLRKGLKSQELCNGINRVQWEGKWLDPGVPARVAYFHTHWVAHFNGYVLCTACTAAEWIRADEWRDFHLNTEPRSPFHITHHYTLVP